MPMSHGICRLCAANTKLRLSHIVPAFVYRWLKESSGNGHIRSTSEPNRRIQDGPQEHWLCTECEDRFNRVETSFATQVFHPYLAASGGRFRYGSWLLPFCTSVSWRVLMYLLEKGAAKEMSASAQDRIVKAEAAWREFLLGKTPHPGVYRQHLLPLDQIESATGGMPSNVNRYLMRAIDLDLCHGGETVFVYSKLGRFIILGFVHEPNPGQWVGAKVNANEGVVEPRSYSLPKAFGEYLMEKAGRVPEAMSSISGRQQAKIEDAFRSNIDRIAGSDFFKAMQADVEMFGEAAFTSGRPTKDEL